MTSPSSAAPSASLITPQAAPTSTTTAAPLPSPPSTTIGTTTTTTNPQSTTSHPPPPSTTTSLSSLPFPPLHHAHPNPPPPSTTHSTPLSPTLPGPPRQIAEARQALVASIGNMLDASLRDRASVLHSNSAAISKQERDVAKATDALRRENDKLAKVAGDAARRVKELGNVQNWAEVLERDFLVLEETLRLVRGEGEGSEDGSYGSGSGSWSGSESGGSERGDERDGDGDVRMAGVSGKGKGKELEVDDRMDVDGTELVMPALRIEESSVNGNGTGETAMYGSDVGLPAVMTGKGEPSIKVPGIETESSKISLEDELRSAMAESIANIE